MALGVPGFVRIGAAIAGCALVAACTPEPGPTTTPTPAPSATASPTPSATPTETEIERQQRLDWDAAERAYRKAVAESDRVARAGGATEPTQALTAVTTGNYLKLQQQILNDLKERGQRVTGGVTVVYVGRDGGYRPDRLRLVTCEDNSTWRILNRANRDVTPTPQLDYVQSLVVTKVKDAWKVSDGTTRQVKDLPKQECRL